MCDDNTKKPVVVFGPLVEDSTVVGGIDPRSGQSVIKAKPLAPAKKQDESFVPTDPRER